MESTFNSPSRQPADFRAALVQTIARSGLSHEALLRSVGYRQPGAVQHERLDAIIASPTLGLDAGGYDFKYTNEELILALAKTLDLNVAEALAYTTAQKTRISENRAAFKPYLWIDTNFKRTSQPVFALAATEQFRHLHFPEEFWRKPLAEQLEAVRTRVRTYLQKQGHEVFMWGPIRRFLFFVQPTFAYIIDLKGEVISTWEREPPNRAVLYAPS